jgi:hypothetical protein
VLRSDLALNSRINLWSDLLNNMDAMIRKLQVDDDGICDNFDVFQRSLLLTINPSNLLVFNVYTSIVDDQLCRAEIKTLPINWRCKPKYRSYFSLDDALASLGGCPLFMMLFATVSLCMFSLIIRLLFITDN